MRTPVAPSREHTLEVHSEVHSEVQSPAAPDASPRAGGVTWRAVLLSLGLAALFGCAIPYNDYLFRNTRLGGTHIIQSSLMADMKGFLLPSFLHAWKLAHDRKIPTRPLLALIFACISIAFALGIWTNLRLGYEHGALGMQDWYARTGPQEPPRTARELGRGVEDNFGLNWFWFATGAGLLSAIVAARSLFSWFPLHPIGLLMWSPYVMYMMWLSIFLGWLAKVLLLRFGGTEAYRRVVPGFLGLILGDVTMMTLWAAVAAWQGRTGQDLLPL